MKTNLLLIVAICSCLYGMTMAEETALSAPNGETEKESASPSISPVWKSKTVHDAKDGKLIYQVENIDKIDVSVQKIPDNRIIEALKAYEFLFLNKVQDDVPEGVKKYFTNEKYMKGGDIRLVLEFPARKSIIDCKAKKEAVLSLKDLYEGKLEKGLYQVYTMGVFKPESEPSPLAFATQYRIHRIGGEVCPCTPSTILVRVGDLKVEQSFESTDGLKVTVFSRSDPEQKIEAKVQYLDENGKNMGSEIPAGEVMRIEGGDMPSFIKVTTPQETFIDWVRR